jgi:site-specific recombinase XerD
MLPEHAAYAAWLARRFPGSQTCWHYPNDLDLIRAWFGKPLAALGVQDVDRYIQHALDLGHKPGTIKRRLASLSSYFLFLDLTLPSPPRCPVIPRRHRMRQPSRLPRDIDDAAVGKLFAVIHRVRDRAMFALMYVCGLRLGEVRNLRLSGLHLEPLGRCLPRVVFIGKGDKERSVPVASFAHRALTAWLAVRPHAPDDAVFVTRALKPFSTVSIRRLLDRYCARAGVKFSCHQLRHAFARLLAERGVPVTTIQQLLGHKHLETTQIYITVSDPVMMAFYDAAMSRIEANLPFIALSGAASS